MIKGKAKKIRHITMRFQPDLHAKLVALAKEQGRSFHSQVMYFLRQAVVHAEPRRAIGERVPGAMRHAKP